MGDVETILTLLEFYTPGEDILLWLVHIFQYVHIFYDWFYSNKMNIVNIFIPLEFRIVFTQIYLKSAFDVGAYCCLSLTVGPKYNDIKLV